MDDTMDLTPPAPIQPAPLVPNMSNGTDGRKRVSQACKPCGAKKVKCDGVSPICTSCRTRGVECVYGESKRRSRQRYADRPRARSSQPPPSHIPTPQEYASGPPYTSHEYLGHQQPIRPRINVAGNHHDPVSALDPELSTRLFQNYFNYIHPLWPILYKPLYASLDYGRPTSMMPPALVGAMYTIGASINTPDNPILPDAFFDDAVKLIEQDGVRDVWHAMNGTIPTITNCQVLTILALQQRGVAEHTKAAMLCGLACTMAIEMRLHRPDTSSDPIQKEVRSRLWWNLYVLEKVISGEMGNPALLRAEEADCPMPSTSEADEFELMSTYTRDQSSAPTRNTSIKLQTISGLHASVNLSIIMERISREIYGVGARRAIRADFKLGDAKRLEIWSELRTWGRHMEQGNLRLDLDNDLTSIPASIINHLVMYRNTILLHRPFFASWNPYTSASTTNPFDDCLSAANDICLILEKYFDRLQGLPCDLASCVFIAGAILLHNSKRSRGEEGSETRRQLKLCIHWLSIMGVNLKTVGRRHQTFHHVELPTDTKTNGHSGTHLPLGQLPLPQLGAPAPHIQNTPPFRNAPLPQPPATTAFTAVNGSPHVSLPTHLPQTPHQSPAPLQQYQDIKPQFQHQHQPLPPYQQQLPQQYQDQEDWSFLQSFGDATDEFYTLDNVLREFLRNPPAALVDEVKVKYERRP